MKKRIVVELRASVASVKNKSVSNVSDVKRKSVEDSRRKSAEDLKRKEFVLRQRNAVDSSFSEFQGSKN